MSLSSSRSPDRKRKRSSAKKTTAVLKKKKKSRGGENEKWKRREWCSSTKTRWQQPAESSGGQSSVDAWEHAKPKGKWTEVSADCRVLDALVKEKYITWTKSGRESAKRETDLYDMLEEAATDEKKEERDREKLGKKLEALLTKKEEEDEATCLMEEIMKNVVAAEQKSFEAGQKSMQRSARICRHTRQRSGPGQDLMTKCWQSMQSRGTQNMNLEKTWKTYTPQPGEWVGMKKTRREDYGHRCVEECLSDDF